MGGRKGEGRNREKKEIQGKDGKGGEERNRARAKGRNRERKYRGRRKDGGEKEELKE